MKKYLFLSAAFFILSCTPKESKITENKENLSLDSSSQQKKDTVEVMPIGDNSQVSVDWVGTYEALLPCADCPGIKSILVLKQDNTFTLSEEYLERNVKNEDQGSFTWDKNGQKITLNGQESKNQYLVGENQLFHLNQEGHQIEGPLKDNFIYKKK